MTWGKLLGTGKLKGIQVFERFEGTKRILTSVKNSKVYKTFTKTTEVSEGRGKYISALSKFKSSTTEIRDAEGNTIRRVYRDIEECPDKGYKKASFQSWNDKESLFFGRWVEKKADTPEEITHVLEDEATGYRIQAATGGSNQQPWVTLKVYEPLECDNGVRVNPGVFNCPVDKGGLLTEPYPTDDVHINADGAQSLLNELRNNFKFLFE